MQSSVLRSGAFELAFDEVELVGSEQAEVARGVSLGDWREFCGKARRVEARDCEMRCGVNGRCSSGKPN